MIPIDKDLLIEIDKLLYELDMLHDFKNSNEIRLRLEKAISEWEAKPMFVTKIIDGKIHVSGENLAPKVWNMKVKE